MQEFFLYSVSYLLDNLYTLLPSGQTCHVQDPSHFTCPSGIKCLRADFLCDSKKNCGDGTDEIRCGEERLYFKAWLFSTFLCEMMTSFIIFLQGGVVQKMSSPVQVADVFHGP